MALLERSTDERSCCLYVCSLKRLGKHKRNATQGRAACVCLSYRSALVSATYQRRPPPRLARRHETKHKWLLSQNEECSRYNRDAFRDRRPGLIANVLSSFKEKNVQSCSHTAGSNPGFLFRKQPSVERKGAARHQLACLWITGVPRKSAKQNSHLKGLSSGLNLQPETQCRGGRKRHQEHQATAFSPTRWSG